jgi:hypothetical protein
MTNLNWTMSSNVKAVVEVTLKDFGFPNGLGGGYQDLGTQRVEVSDQYDFTTEEAVMGQLHHGWSKSFVSAKLQGIYTNVWYTAKTLHGIQDIKGRELGHRFVISRTREGWELRPHATRDGASFGALQSAIKCATLEEAQAKAVVLAADGKKRAAKNAAKNGGVYKTGK